MQRRQFMAFRLFLAFFFLALSCSLSQNIPNYTFLHDATSAPEISRYDYIIVGGGTAGCPLAATLSQNYTVLVLERGGSPYGNPNITDLSRFGAPLADDSPSSPSQRFVSEDGVFNARARVLGGGTCINAGFYTRAQPGFVTRSGWDPRLVGESYEWVERTVAFRPPVREWQSAVRDGLVEVGVLPYNGFTYDHVNGTKVGGTIFDQNGHRHTAADLLESADPNRLTVLLRAVAHKILFTNRNGRSVASGVIYRDASDVLRTAYLSRRGKGEVILTAGALGSPQLLMLSGVGPEAQLKAQNIAVVLDQPMVGQNMSDNPMNAIFVPSPVPVEVSLIQVVGITHFGSFIEAASGDSFAASSPERDFGMFSPKIGQFATVPPKQRTQEAMAKAIKLMDSLPVGAFRGGFILEKVDGPMSRGHLELRTKNPNDNPSVTFNYFKDPQDLQRCVEGIKTVVKIIESKSLSKFRYDRLSAPGLLNVTLNFPVSMVLLEQFCKDTVMTIWHYHGGCVVGDVVDGDYKVIGVDSLRVVDGSTFRYSPGTNPQATVMMLGRYMGVKILRDRLAAEESN